MILPYQTSMSCTRPRIRRWTSSSVARAAVSTASERQLIHILGAGSIGLFLAHGLQKPQLGDGSVSLILHNQKKVAEWRVAGECITLVTQGHEAKRRGYLVELATKKPASVIRNLIVATKASDTVPALRSAARRITSETNILFMQNGMGTIEEVEDSGLFPDPLGQPTFYGGICSHGVNGALPFVINHAGRGKIMLGRLSTQKNPLPADNFPDKDVPLIQRLLQVEDFASEAVPATTFKAVQLEKLAINAMINPITVLINGRNGEITRLHENNLRSLFDCLLAETGLIVRALLEEAGQEADVLKRFSDECLRDRVLAVAEATSDNISSMLQDVQMGRETEIDYINGYIAQQAERLGISHPCHRDIITRVKSCLDHKPSIGSPANR